MSKNQEWWVGLAKELQKDEDTIKVDQDVPMPEEDMPSGSIN